MKARLAWFFAAVAVVAAACGGSRSPESGAADGGASESLDSGAYEDEGSLCCPEDAGRTCCSATAGSEDCYAYRGCVTAGGQLSGKDGPCLRCCGDMALIANEAFADGGCVDLTVIDNPYICASCGDGRCDAEHGENVCNCPADCP